ncbi:hypothetical protein FGRMN_5324 [Fusarium graminum]|nr:hypothetical protein FGRMN_5324 [Fusarium graminum]
MAEQYNNMALKAGYPPAKMRAMQGDLIDPESTPSDELDTPAFFNFDLVAMCMALHHIEDHEDMILQLSKRLRPGGILLIVDWVSQAENSNLQSGIGAMSISNRNSKRMGFEEEDIKTGYEKAGLEDISWKWASAPSQVPREVGGKQQLFLARGMKPLD